MIKEEKIQRTLKHLSRYSQILLRCYDTEVAAYKNYGAKGITMCDEWLNSPDQFIKWCEENGYEEGLVLDKDILCDKLGVFPKIYSPTTCQFITSEENMEYMLSTIKRQAVASYDKNGNFVKAYKSISEAEAKHRPNIGRAIKGERLTAGGYYWINIENINSYPLTIKVPKPKPRGFPIIEVNENNEIIGTYTNISQAAKKLGLHSGSIQQVVSGARPSLFGRKFKRKLD